VTVKVFDINNELVGTLMEPVVAKDGFGKGGMGGGGGGKGGGKGGGAGAGKEPSVKPGVHQVTWNMSLPAKDGKGGGKGGKGGGGFGGGGFGGAAFNQAPAGLYRVVMTVDGKQFSTTVRIEADPNVPARPNAGEVEPVIDVRKIN